MAKSPILLLLLLVHQFRVKLSSDGYMRQPRAKSINSEINVEFDRSACSPPPHDATNSINV